MPTQFRHRQARNRTGFQCAAILLATFCLAVAALPAKAEPALWVVKKGAATVYLFGTVHALKAGTDWQSPKIRAAFAQSRDLWIEVDDDDPAAARDLVATLGVDAQHPLSGKLGPADSARLDRAARAAGITQGEAALEPMRPWMAALTLVSVPIVAAGFEPGSGADLVLKAAAKRAGKRVHAFETLKQQLHFFADLPLPTEREILLSTLDEVDDGPKKLNEIVDAWLHGDTDALQALLLDMTQAKYQDLYQVILVNRNHAWAERLATRLATGGTDASFVAVGAAHLLGPDSLIHDLELKGYTVERE